MLKKQLQDISQYLTTKEQINGLKTNLEQLDVYSTEYQWICIQINDLENLIKNIVG